MGTLSVKGGTLTIVGAGSSSDPRARLLALLSGARTAPVRLAFTGSSSTEGTGATTAANRYVNRLVSFAQFAYPNGGTEAATQASTSGTFTPSSTAGVQGYNAGQAGTYASDYLTAGERTLLAALNPAAVFHMVGSNDYSVNSPPANYKASLIASASDFQTKAPGVIQIFVHSYQRLDTTAPTYPWTDYAQAVAEVVALDPANRIMVDASKAFAAIGVPGADPANVIGVDDIHSTDSGHLLLAEVIRVALGIRTQIVVGTDTAAPTVPTGLTVTGTTSTTASLSWTASTDNVGVVGYRVRRAGTIVGSPTGTTFTDTGLTASTGYSYTVSALDAAGNESAQTSAVTGTTTAPPALVADTFNRTDGDLNGSTTTSASKTWTVITTAGAAAPAGDILIQSNVVGPKPAGIAASDVAYVDVAATDYTLETTLTALGSTAATRGGGLAFRVATNGTGYMLTTRVNGTTQGWALYTLSLSILASTTTVIPAAGDTLRVVVSGTTVNCYVVVGGVATLLFTYGSLSLNPTSTLAGLTFTTAGTATRLDNFIRTA